MTTPQPPAETKTSNPTQTEQEKLYDALKRVGVYNITTLVRRLNLPAKEALSQEENKLLLSSSKPRSDVRQNAKELLKLMGLNDSDECAATLEKICLQGREMLGEISKPTITSAPVGQPGESSKYPPRTGDEYNPNK
jgi:hypothetical protein